MSLRISASMIDSFRQYFDKDLSEEQLLARIKKEEPPSKYMQLGTAFHEFLEKPHETYREENDCFEAENGIVMPGELVRSALDCIQPGGESEIKTVRDYYIDGEIISIVAKADQLFGRWIFEHKTNWTGFAYDRYADSYQWRFYLDAFDADRVYYNVFCFSNTKSRGLEMKDVKQFYYTRHCLSRADLVRMLRHVGEYIHFRNLEQYFQPKQENDYADTI